MARLGPTGLTQVFVEIKNWVVSKLSSKANDSDVVHKSEDETITGIKVFNNSLVKTGSGNWGNILTLKNIGTIKSTAPDNNTVNNAIRFASSDYTDTYYTTEAEIIVQKLTTGDNRFSLAISSNSNTTASGMASLSLYSNKRASWDGAFTATTFNGDLVGNVTGTADKATQDSDGNQINTTYSKVGHTHDDRYYTESEINTKLSGKANTSGTYSSLTVGNATKATQDASGNVITDTYATKLYVDNEISGMVNSAPETLDTLNELASALGNDANFATTIATQIGTKANDSSVVHTTGDETIEGTKTFSSTIVGSVTGNATTATSATKATQDANGDVITTTYATKTDLSGKANDADVVHLANNESITGIKYFTADIYNKNVNTVVTETPTTNQYIRYIFADNNNDMLASIQYANRSNGTRDLAFYLKTANSSTLGVVLNTDKSFYPLSNAYSLGTSSLKWANVYATNFYGDSGSFSYITTSAQHFLRNIYGNYGTFWRQDATNLYLLLTASGDQTGGWTSARPIQVNLSTGVCDINGNASTATQFSANKSVTLTGDVTGTASSNAGWSVATTLANSGATAGTYGPTTDVTGNNNATIVVPQITVDAKGRVTAVTTKTLTCKNNTYTVNDATLTIQKNGTTVKTFTANASSDVTANITVPTKVSELTNDSGFLTSHQTVTNSAPTLAWGTTSTIGSVGNTALTVNMPANPNTDTKNTAGSTDTSSKIFLIGATSQAANPQTYSHDTVYVGTDGCLYSDGEKVLTAHQSLANYSTLANTVKSLSISGKTITVTPGSGSAYTLTTQDTVDWSGVINKPTTFTPSSHTHGQITNDGGIGTAANKPLITTTGGVVTTGSFGTAANTFCQGNDSRLSDARTPKAHTHAKSDITDFPTLATVATSGSYNDLSNKPTIPVIDSTLSATSTNGLQNKVIKTALDGKANSSHIHTKSQITDFPALATVATSGSYNDLSNKPAIPTVNNATLTIQKNGTTVKTFTANASSDVTANITVPTKVSELTNDSGFLTAHQSLANYSTLANTVKSLSISGKTITVTPGSGSAYTLTTQDTVYTHPTTAGNKHIPSGGSSGQILKNSGSGTAVWTNPSFTRTFMQIASRTSAGTWTISGVSANTIIYVAGTVTLSKTVPSSVSHVYYTSGVMNNSLWGTSTIQHTSGENVTAEFFIAAFPNSTSVNVTIEAIASTISAVSLKAYQ